MTADLPQYGTFHRRPRQRLLTPCWCQRYADLIDTTDIIRGRTWSCGAKNCQPPKDAA